MTPTAAAHMDLDFWRKEFPSVASCVYMISHSLGAMPRRVRQQLDQYAETWERRGIRAWEEGWWEMPVTIGNLLGEILGAPPGSITMHQNVAIAEAVVISCFDFRSRRNKVVYTDMDFPSVMYAYEAQRRNGARIEMVSSDDGISTPTERLLEAIDEETLLVPISHVLFRSSLIQDVEAIIQRAHSVGAHVVLDIYQSAGTLPLNLHQLGVSFAVGGSVKWLCGGPGAGYLYVRPDLAGRLEPALTGWMAHQHPFDFEIGAIQYAHDGFRFLNGTPHIPALYAAHSGYEIIREIGVAAIRAKSQRQTERMIAWADEFGFTVRSPRNPEHRAGSVVVDVPAGDRVCRELILRNFLVDYRPEAGIRMAPHFYNTDEEVDAVMQEVRRIVAGE